LATKNWQQQPWTLNRHQPRVARHSPLRMMNLLRREKRPPLKKASKVMRLRMTMKRPPMTRTRRSRCRLRNDRRQVKRLRKLSKAKRKRKKTTLRRKKKRLKKRMNRCKMKRNRLLKPQLPKAVKLPRAAMQLLANSRKLLKRGPLQMKRRSQLSPSGWRIKTDRTQYRTS